MKSRLFALALITLVPNFVFAQQTDKAYISDELTVFVHTGPTRNYRIVGTVVAGSQIEILAKSEDGSFSQIQYEDGKTGWIESQYVSQTASIQQQLKTLKSELAEKTESLSQLENELNTQKSEKMLIEGQLQRHTQSTQDLQNKLESAQKQLAVLQQQDVENQEKVKMDWLIKGGMLSLGSLIIGYILAMMPRRRKRSPDLF
ncbi:TIGR04211 family SH3 domain-containing protein [Catenovulum sediminis]|uniref:TIGR04211 family SH3 domain-containing protein n=1 Tax=Catenovulum sediminis TaxID=1740262 RepID=A0ABV1RD49_9ALTE|nr:TIGR04211 family SH3 domain-containing protein [Catenovulum sediminis]